MTATITLSNSLPRLIGSIALAIIFSLALTSIPNSSIAPFQVKSQQAPIPQSTPTAQAHLIGEGHTDFVHSASITALANGDLFAVWFAGTREGHRDVVIKSSRYNSIKSEWSTPSILVNRQQTGNPQVRVLRKLGNPVVAATPSGRVWTFYVSVSVGGWAGSAINAMYSDDNGHTWSSPSRLITSPFFNISTLVRTHPTFHENGDIGLPVYHEFLGKFSEYLILNENGQVKNKRRISRGRATLQPAIVPTSPTSAVAFLRWGQSKPGVVLTSMTKDSGLTWSKPQAAPVNNPNSSLAAIELDTPNDILVALNDTEDGRHRLSLFKVDDQLNEWTPVTILDTAPNTEGDPVTETSFKQTLESERAKFSTQLDADRLTALTESIDRRVCKDEKCYFEYEYPHFTKDQSGNIHLVYSWNNGLIKHFSFNKDWIKSLEPTL